MHQLVGGNRLMLTKCRRSDDILFNLCLKVLDDTLDASEFNNKICRRGICYTNKKRILKNKESNERHYEEKKKKQKGTLKFVRIEKNETDENSQDMMLFSEVQLISHVNNKELDICNGECFEVKQVKKDTIIISDGVDERIINFEDVKKCFYLGYVLTCHKSQGSTFNFEYTIYEYEMMSCKMKYVALSRGTTKDNINIC